MARCWKNKYLLPPWLDILPRGGEHDELAATISVIPRKFADEYCPFCLGTDGRISLMAAVPSPSVEHDANVDFYKCSICKTIFGKNISDLWSVADD